MRILYLALVTVMITGCAASQAVQNEASKTLKGACLKLFSTGNYQGHAQAPLEGTPVFAISHSEDKIGMVCAFSYGGSVSTTMEGRRARALSSCERYRANSIQSEQKPYDQCVIFAEGNNIKYR